MKTLILIVSALFSLHVSAQSVQMHVLGQGDSYWITATKREHTFQVVYARRDSTDGRKLNKLAQQRGITLRMIATNFGEFGSEQKKRLDEYSALRESCTYYTKDSLRFKADAEPRFTQLFDSLLILSEKDLNTNLRAKEKYFILDGTSFSWVITDHTTVKNVYAHAPQENSYPLLYHYIKACLNLYRTRIKGDLLRNFMGY
ncbi:hypothetical protein [Siphonobacter sp.]|uniref:hypothetical protein n=1 Tax=Siphonobacter sp. TaxID=1869184 RepID=UPI003B3AD78D